MSAVTIEASPRRCLYVLNYKGILLHDTRLKCNPSCSKYQGILTELYVFNLGPVLLFIYFKKLRPQRMEDESELHVKKLLITDL